MHVWIHRQRTSGKEKMNVNENNMIWIRKHRFIDFANPFVNVSFHCVLKVKSYIFQETEVVWMIIVTHTSTHKLERSFCWSGGNIADRNCGYSIRAHENFVVRTMVIRVLSILIRFRHQKFNQTIYATLEKYCLRNRPLNRYAHNVDKYGRNWNLTRGRMDGRTVSGHMPPSLLCRFTFCSHVCLSSVCVRVLVFVCVWNWKRLQMPPMTNCWIDDWSFQLNAVYTIYCSSHFVQRPPSDDEFLQIFVGTLHIPGDTSDTFGHNAYIGSRSNCFELRRRVIEINSFSGGGRCQTHNTTPFSIIQVTPARTLPCHFITIFFSRRRENEWNESFPFCDTNRIRFIVVEKYFYGWIDRRWIQYIVMRSAFFTIVILWPDFFPRNASRSQHLGTMMR